MIKILGMLKNTVNKYVADLRPDRLMTYQSERKLVVSRRPCVLITFLWAKGCRLARKPDNITTICQAIV
jgi:hypothetical protein